VSRSHHKRGSRAQSVQNTDNGNLFNRAILVFLSFLVIAGCDSDTRQTLSDKLDERDVSALQDIARDRDCLPLADIQNIRKSQQSPGQIEFLLRDGSRWVNADVPLNCQVPEQLSIALPSQKRAVCAGDEVRLLQSNSTTFIDKGLCKLTRFQRL